MVPSPSSSSSSNQRLAWRTLGFRRDVETFFGAENVSTTRLFPKTFRTSKTFPRRAGFRSEIFRRRDVETFAWKRFSSEGGTWKRFRPLETFSKRRDVETFSSEKHRKTFPRRSRFTSKKRAPPRPRKRFHVAPEVATWKRLSRRGEVAGRRHFPARRGNVSWKEKRFDVASLHFAKRHSSVPRKRFHVPPNSATWKRFRNRGQTCAARRDAARRGNALGVTETFPRRVVGGKPTLPGAALNFCLVFHPPPDAEQTFPRRAVLAQHVATRRDVETLWA